MPTLYTIKDMQALAAEFKGRCLSKEYIDQYTPLTWQCAKGHSWEADVIVIKQGGWCKQCLKEEEKENYFKKIKELANEKGGECVSQEYAGSTTKLKFRCARDHQWSMAPINLTFKGSWCQKCRWIDQRENEFTRLRDRLKKHGINCKDQKYINNRSVLKLQCDKGHKWATPAHWIISHPVCDKCRVEAIKEGQLKEMQLLAKERGGLCISERYVEQDSRLKWECARGHRWTMTPRHMLKGNWCYKCHWLDYREKEFNRLKALAVEHGGTCLSKRYKTKDSKLQFQCKNGHKWFMQARTLNEGSWCHQCTKDEFYKEQLEKCRAVAKKKGGKCLSTEILTSDHKLKFLCKEGHLYWSTAYNVLAGHWCGICGREASAHKTRKYTLTDIKQYAVEHQGKLVSKNYTTVDEPLQWQCSEGHIFSISATGVRIGHWCPKCSKARAAAKQRIYSVEYFRKYAEGHKGKLLSTEYTNLEKPLKWQCDKGHVWEIPPFNMVYRGSWYCPVCRVRKDQRGKEELKQKKQQRLPK